MREGHLTEEGVKESGWAYFCQTRTIRRELGIPPETVSRQDVGDRAPQGRA